MTGETIGAIGYGVAATGLFLADATGAIPTLDGLNITQVSSIGFAIWYGWYTTTRAIPRIIEQQGIQLQAMESRHRASIAEAAQVFRDELAAVRRERELDREHFRCVKDAK